MSQVPSSMELTSRVRLPYVEQGDRSGVPVIFLHGITDSWRSFEPVLPHLPASIHAFALTQRGHGDADRPESGYSSQDFAADIAAFMDSQELESAIIAGHSMGSYVAQRFAIDYPERTMGVVLMGAFATARDNPVLVEFWDDVVATLEDPIDPAFVREFQESTLAQPIPPAFLDAVVQESLKVPARVWTGALGGMLDSDQFANLDKIAAPTLIIWGDQDPYCPRQDQYAMDAAIANSRLLVYAGAGHAFHWEEPERFAADLVAFAEDVAK
jgi:non-heme chloroperoxidase